MSGPKVDIARLKEQELQRLMRQRQGRMLLTADINKQIKQIMDTFIACSADGADIQSHSKLITELQKEYTKKLEKILSRACEEKELFNCDDARQKCNDITAEFFAKAKTSFEIIKESRESNREYLQQEQHRLAQMTMKKSAPVAVSLFQNASSKKTVDYSSIVSQFRNEVSALMEDSSLLSSQKNTILKLLNEFNTIVDGDQETYKKFNRVKRLYDDFTAVVSTMETERIRIAEKYEQYLQELFDSNETPASLNSFTSVAEIEKAIDEVKERASSMISREYIKRQIDDVMSNYGYNVVNSELLEATTKTGQVLYGVDDSTAIDVFVSNENQVTMRVVGIGFDDKLSEADDEKLYQQQCAFCSMHPQITKELSRRGIILEVKKHNPPDKRFNKKIQTRSSTEDQKISRAKKQEKAKSNTLKTMHKG